MQIDNLGRCAPVFEGNRHGKLSAFEYIRDCPELIARGIVRPVNVSHLVGPQSKIGISIAFIVVELGGLPQALGRLNLIRFVWVVFGQPVIRDAYRHFVIRAQTLTEASLQRLPRECFVQQVRIARIADVLRIVAIQHAFRDMRLNGFHALGFNLEQASRIGAVVVPFWRALRQIARMPKHNHSVIARSKRRLRTRSIGFNREIKVGRLDRADIDIAVIHVRHRLHGTKAQSS